MKHLLVACCLLSLTAASLRAEDPTPAPQTLVAPKEVSGTGKKLDPYIFTTSTRCILQLTGDNKDVLFDVEDAPSDTTILDNRYASFSLYEPGLFQLTAHGGTVYSKVWFQIKSGTDPPPGPGPTPGPTPGPPPAEVTGPLYVVIIRDTATLSKVPQAQQLAITSLKVKEYCATHCLKGADGKTPEFRIYEPDTDVSRQSPGMQKAFNTTVEDRRKAGDSAPWIGISNGKTGYSGPVPDDEAKLLEKLTIYGGK